MATGVEAQIAGSVRKIEAAAGAEEDVLPFPAEAPCAGRVHEIRVREGDGIEEGAVLAVIE